MTNHYNIEIKQTNAILKVTYRNKKFRRVELIKGKLSDKTLVEIGRIIPPREDEFKRYIVHFEKDINYSVINKEKSLYSKFNNAWFQFYEKAVGFSPKFTGADGKALKQIITYLKKINAGNERVALENWQLILNSWQTLKEFHQDNTDLKYINSRLNVIIREIVKNNGSDTTGADSSVSI